MSIWLRHASLDCVCRSDTERAMEVHVAVCHQEGQHWDGAVADSTVKPEGLVYSAGVSEGGLPKVKAEAFQREVDYWQRQLAEKDNRIAFLTSEAKALAFKLQCSKQEGGIYNDVLSNDRRGVCTSGTATRVAKKKPFVEEELVSCSRDLEAQVEGSGELLGLKSWSLGKGQGDERERSSRGAGWSRRALRRVMLSGRALWSGVLQASSGDDKIWRRVDRPLRYASSDRAPSYGAITGKSLARWVLSRLTPW